MDIETGNQNFISEINQSETEEVYSFNYQNKTKSSIKKNRVNQSKEEFELDSLVQKGIKRKDCRFGFKSALRSRSLRDRLPVHNRN